MSRGRGSVWLALENCMWVFLDVVTLIMQSLIDFIERCRQRRFRTEVRLPPKTTKSEGESRWMNDYNDGDPPPNCAAPSPSAVQPPRVHRYYAVAAGHKPGIYMSWHEAALQVNGFGNNIHRAFQYRHQAEFFMRQNGVDKQSSG